MTAVIHHGFPGTYKTFAVIMRVIIPALKKGRVVVTNIRGLDSLVKIEDAIGEKLPKEAEILYVPNGTSGFKAMGRFFHWAPVGALIVMDETQRIFPTRSTFKLKTLDYPGGEEQAEADGRPPTLEIAIDMHRHYNWDIYFTTTNVAKVNKEIRQVVEGAYRHRNLSGVLPWWKNTWKEFPHDAESSGKTISHYTGDPKRYTADTRIFDCYQSTATGVAKDSLESKPIYKDKRIVFYMGCVLLALVAFFYNLQQAISGPDIASTEDVEMVVVSSDKQNSSVSGSDVVNGSVHTPGDSPPVVVKIINPYPGAKFYITGSVNKLLILDVEINEQITSLTSFDLEQIGYHVELLTDCLVSLNLAGVVRFAVCHPVSNDDPRIEEKVDVAFI